MTNLFLIAHRVRGEPTFDIAICCTEEDGWGTYSDPAPWWLMPTTGWRVYPYWSIEVSHLIGGPNDWTIDKLVPPMPLGTPDIFEVNSQFDPTTPMEDRIDAAGLLLALGLLKPKPTIRRRV